MVTPKEYSTSTSNDLPERNRNKRDGPVPMVLKKDVIILLL